MQAILTISFRCSRYVSGGPTSCLFLTISLRYGRYASGGPDTLLVLFNFPVGSVAHPKVCRFGFRVCSPTGLDVFIVSVFLSTISGLMSFFLR